MKNVSGRERAGGVPFETAYQLELAVGASHIASMLTPESRGTCIEELVASFVARHGRNDLMQFLAVLAERLDLRDNKDGALAVREFAAGASPVAPLTSAPGSRPKKAKTAATSRAF
jgi:hypothetical protein